MRCKNKKLLQYSQALVGQLALYNTLGQLVWSVRAIPSGYDAYNLPNNLAQGMYYYHFTPNHPEEEKKPVIVGKILLVGG